MGSAELMYVWLLREGRRGSIGGGGFPGLMHHTCPGVIHLIFLPLEVSH